ncbi:MAG TPA: hypothetical protein VN317_00650 [Candidatus Methanoperedens sp.]|nr:hypothetical protein [Candidatus Methanoperedens sp.]
MRRLATSIAVAANHPPLPGAFAPAASAMNPRLLTARVTDADGWRDVRFVRLRLRESGSQAVALQVQYSADAAGLPIFPGLVRFEEAEAGLIPHTLRFTAARTRRRYVHPATHFASASDDPALPPMGLRVRLKPGYDLSGFPPRVRAILQAMKTYGMLLADNGSNWFVSGAPNENWDDDELHLLGEVKGADFEAVYTGPLLP